MAVAHVNAKHKVFLLPYEQVFVDILGGRSIAGPGGPMVVVPHTRDTVRFARNLGHRVPAPILSQYTFPPDTFAAQKTTAALLTMNQRAFVLSEIGTGKTRAALHALNFLMLSGEIKHALVIAPLSTLSRVWETEIFRHFPHLTTAVLHGTRDHRRATLASAAHIYIINYDGVETIESEFQAYMEIDLVILDELSYYRNSQMARWKVANRVLQGRSYVWGMTGSPTPNEPADAYGQMKLLTPKRVPKYFNQFRDTVMTKVSQFRWVPKDTALSTVYNAMQPAVRFLRKDVAELPETSYQTREVALGAGQERIYKALFAKAYYAFTQGEVTAVNEGVLMSKLLQVACGWVYTTARATVELDNAARVDALLELLQETSSKVIVFVPFINAAEALFARLQSEKLAVELVTGATSLGERNRIFQAFQDTPALGYIVAHPGCMSHGLTLTAANTIVWFSPTTSLETYEQANGRITRPGQKDKTLVVHLCGSAVERKLYGRLEKKAKVQGALLEMFEQ